MQLFLLAQSADCVRKFVKNLFDEYGAIEQGPRRDKLTVEINCT